MNGTSRPEAARAQHTQKDTPAPDNSMIEVDAGTVAHSDSRARIAPGPIRARIAGDRRPAPTQTQRVIALLRERGCQGLPLNTVDLLGPVVDAGKPIVRLAARVNELRDAGFSIETARTLNGTANYYLRGEPLVTVPPPIEPAELEHQARLFTVAPRLQDARLDPLPNCEGA